MVGTPMCNPPQEDDGQSPSSTCPSTMRPTARPNLSGLAALAFGSIASIRQPKFSWSPIAWEVKPIRSSMSI